MKLSGWIDPEELEIAIGKKEIDFSPESQYEKEQDLTPKQAKLIADLMVQKNIRKLTDLHGTFVPKKSTGFISVGMAAKVIDKLLKK